MAGVGSAWDVSVSHCLSKSGPGTLSQEVNSVPVTSETAS